MSGVTRAVLYGRFLELKTYEREPFGGKPKKKVEREDDPLILRRRLFRNVLQLRRSFVRLVQANLIGSPPAFMTLTYASHDEVSLRVSRGHLRRFTLAFDRSVRWIAVPEWQQRGQIHWHLLVWGLSDVEVGTERQTRKYAQRWGHGFLDLHMTDGSQALAFYLGKYFTKTVLDERLVRARAYTCSRSCYRPVVLSPAALSYLDELWDFSTCELDYFSEYETMFFGRCEFKRFKKLQN